MKANPRLLALGLCSALSAAAYAQTIDDNQPVQPTQNRQQMTAPQPSSSQTQTQQRLATSNTSTSHFTRSDGQTVEVRSGQPPMRDFGPKPSFEQLDTNHDGIITKDEAQAYIPLLNDFDHVSDLNRVRISRAQYNRWDKSH